MRICFVAHAGSANTISWVNHFADVMGHDVHLISLCPADGLSAAVGLDVVPVTGPAALRYFLAIPFVRRRLREIAPDLVVGYRVASYGFLAAAAGGRPLAVAAQGKVVLPPMAFLKLLLARYALRRADLVNSWAPHMTRRLVELGADAAKVLTCPRGIDLGLFRPGSDVDDRSETVMVTRTMHSSYRHDLVLQAVAIARRSRPGLRCVFIGRGEARGALERLADTLGVRDAVEFPGPVGPERLARLLGGAALYVSAVPTDGVSASLLEAMATGCFPVVTDNEANRLWLDGENGFLVSRPDPEEYARAMVSALENESLRARASEANRRVVEERADIWRNLGRIESAYASLAGSRTRGSA
ncbi:MAG: glycosyltransferase [Candidatus Eisenbacteria bacterium]|nr:glycosyltransferase [Candidatus Eisenbacteria bacterium]